MGDYVGFVNTMAMIFFHLNDKGVKSGSFRIDDIYPLRIFKAVMTMFCDINHDCFGDERLRQFLIDKESTDFDSKKYTVSMYLNGTNTY